VLLLIWMCLNLNGKARIRSIFNWQKFQVAKRCQLKQAHS
jgi:hypothetical protein